MIFPHSVRKRLALTTILTTALALALTISSLARPALAQNATPQAQRSAEVSQDAAPARPAIPVIVEHSGEDKLGELLAFQLKEAFARTTSFRPARDKEKALRVRLTSLTEIGERPDFGSAYAVTWLFSEGPTVLSYYLDGSMGFVNPGTVKSEAETLTARSDKAVSKFAYLFK